MCLAVTCHLHVWQNDRDHLRATAVTQVGGGGGGGGDVYRNKSQHRKLTPEKRGLEPATFRSLVRRSNH